MRTKEPKLRVIPQFRTPEWRRYSATYISGIRGYLGKWAIFDIFYDGGPLMAQAYIDFAMWAISKEDFIHAFEVETGISYSAPKNAMDKLIDDVSGYGKSVISQFLDWLTMNHWGEA